MQRGIRILGAILLLGGAVFLAWTVALQFDDGLARSSAESSTCNYEPCTAEQLQRMTRIAGPIVFLVLSGFGLVMLKARVVDPPAAEERAASSTRSSADGDVGERLRAIDRLREQDGITALEHTEQRRRILDSV